MSKKVILFWFHFNRCQSLRLLTGLLTLTADVVPVSSWRKRISLFRIENPYNTEGGITDPTNHSANFPYLMIIVYPRGLRLLHI